MSEGFGEKALGWAVTMIAIALFWGGPLGFTCGGSPGLCERLCARHLGVESVDYVVAPDSTPCECRDGSRPSVWPWTRPIAWLTDPAEE